MKKFAAACALALVAMACSPAERAPPSVERDVQSAPLTPSGPAVQVQRAESSDNLQWASSVVQLDPLTNEANGDVKLFGLAGGDPAMNGLHTYLAFFESPAEGWQTFMLGDFLDYRVLSESPNQVELEIQESVMDETTGNIGSQTRNVIVSWTRGADNAPPTAIAVTPATSQSP